MGCANSSTKAAAAPTLLTSNTLLTSKAHSMVVDKGPKDILPVTSKDNFVTTSPPPPEENAEKIEVPSAAEAAKHQPYTLAPKEPEEKSRILLLSDLEPSLAPSPPVGTIKRLDSNVYANPPQSAIESFASNHSGRSAASGYSAATNFTFGQKPSPMVTPTQSLISGRSSNSRLLTLQEEEPLADTESEEVLEDIPEYCTAPSYVADESSDGLPEDSVATMGRAVEQSVHALVDAGESVWSHVKSAWTTRYSMLTPIEEEMDADSDAEGNEVKTSRQVRWRPLRGLDWSCASA